MNFSSANKLFPSEFHQKERSLLDIERWKAVEFRNFLLYSGPVVLKDIIEGKKNDHFLLFHIAIRILRTPGVTVDQIPYADSCLKFFFSNFANLYGDH